VAGKRTQNGKTRIQKERDGKRLLRAISAAGYNQAAFARHTGIGEAQLSRYIRGESEPMQFSKERMAEALRIVELEEIWK
jgi:transcriptional regulator with XRE-family HTH domain